MAEAGTPEVMENYCLYSQEWDSLPLRRISTLGKGAKFNVNRTGLRVDSYEYVWPDLRVTLNNMPREELKDHLRGFVGSVESLSRDAGSNPPTGLVERIKKTRLVLGCVIEPDRDEEGRAEDVLGAICSNTNSLLSYGDSVVPPSSAGTSPGCPGDGTEKTGSEGWEQQKGAYRRGAGHSKVDADPAYLNQVMAE